VSRTAAPLPLVFALALAACAGPAPAGTQRGTPAARPPADPAASLVAIPGARYLAGSSFGFRRGRADERPAEVEVAPFAIMRFEVTNDQFAAFARATGHRTAAEERGFGLVWDGKWRRADGADWRRPFGPDSSIEGRGDHPVIQVSPADAAAFCAHHDLRLPTDAEWELAAGGGDGRRYPWGDEPPTQSGPVHRANFGTVSCCAPDDSDGHATTAPVGSYPAGVSPFDLHDMAGNVWEWTASEFPGKPGTVSLRGGGWGNDPFCLRVAYRHANDRDVVGRDHIGFRCAR
jgi:formylglycine-generating enzyme required for sulfatase activity